MEKSKLITGISVGKQLKRMNDKNQVFLQDGEQFQIFMKNQHTHPVLLWLKVNNTPIAKCHLILRPFEKIFLDRYILTNANKFVFRTYNIDEQDIGKVKDYNGKVEIYLYMQSQIRPTIQRTQNPWITVKPWTTTNPWVYPQITFTNTSLSCGAYKDVEATKLNYQLQTGRIQPSNNISKIKLEQVQGLQFNDYWQHKYEMWIRPQSQMKIQDIVQYCSNCGRRRRDKQNYCPKCGVKF